MGEGRGKKKMWNGFRDSKVFQNSIMNNNSSQIRAKGAELELDFLLTRSKPLGFSLSEPNRVEWNQKLYLLNRTLRFLLAS